MTRDHTQAECYVITIDTNPKSIQSAERCISSAKRFATGQCPLCCESTTSPDLDINIFSAFTPRHDPLNLLQNKGINTNKLHISNNCSYVDAAAGCFLSHLTLWEKCIEINKPIVILEHDAIIKNQIPSNILDGTGFNFVINIGKPSYGNVKIPEFTGINLFTLKHLIGTHAYVVKPDGAYLLIEQAKKDSHRGGGAKAVDMFLNKKKFPFLQELYPWPVEAEPQFTTIQQPRNKYQRELILDEFGKVRTGVGCADLNLPQHGFENGFEDLL